MQDVLRLHQVSYRRGGHTILHEIDLELTPGSSTAIVGPSGTGKSTLLAIIGGLAQPDSGTVERPFAPNETGFVLQAYGLVGLLTAAENVEMALQRPGATPHDVRRRAADALDRVHLSALADHLVEELSGGQQQRIALARALVSHPRLLLADEFTAELDAATRSTVIDLVLNTTLDGTTLVIATHDSTIAARCDRTIELAPPRGT